MTTTPQGTPHQAPQVARKHQPDPKAIAEAERVLHENPPKIGIGPTEWRYIGMVITIGVAAARAYMLFRGYQKVAVQGVAATLAIKRRVTRGAVAPAVSKRAAVSLGGLGKRLKGVKLPWA